MTEAAVPEGEATEWRVMIEDDGRITLEVDSAVIDDDGVEATDFTLTMYPVDAALMATHILGAVEGVVGGEPLEPD